MHWYLLNKNPRKLAYWKLVEPGRTNTDWVEEDVPAGTVCNKIEYDGTSPYNPGDEYDLVSSEIIYPIGSKFNA